MAGIIHGCQRVARGARTARSLSCQLLSMSKHSLDKCGNNPLRCKDTLVLTAVPHACPKITDWHGLQGTPETCASLHFLDVHVSLSVHRSARCLVWSVILAAWRLGPSSSLLTGYF
ncbi:hypothetical protein J6590_065822 [Homalodisca vitripennis]|nr:hypothetical protein J6590_065822 [Homalodisca vitripennis]